MKVIIPAAGLGRRFADEGINTPKELLPLGGRPLIAHALAEAKRAGFDSAVVVIPPAKELLRRYLADNELPLPVEIVIQPQPLGIGDAVLRAWTGEPAGVLLPDDVVLETNHWIELIELSRQTGAATLCVRPVPLETVGRFGIAECQGDQVVRLVEKPPPGFTASNLAIFGRYLITAPVVGGLKAVPISGEVELTNGFAAALTTAKGVRAVRFTGEVYDCGTPAEYRSSIARFPHSSQVWKVQ